MNEIDQLEKQLQSWIPRRPSPKIEERLFGAQRRRGIAAARLLTMFAPVAACALTVLVAVSSASRRDVDLYGQTGVFPTMSVAYDPDAINTLRNVTLNRADGYGEVNVWPRVESAHKTPEVPGPSGSATNR